MRKFFPIHEEAVSHICLCTRSLLISLHMKIILFYFYQCIYQTKPKPSAIRMPRDKATAAYDQGNSEN
jgi:hypothetical protein